MAFILHIAAATERAIILKVNNSQSKRTRIGVILLKKGQINTIQFETALLYQKLLANKGKTIQIGDFLVNHGCLSSQALCRALIAQLKE